MESRNLYLIVEGDTDAIVISEAIDYSGYSHVRLLTLHRRDAMASYVRTIRLMSNENDKIVVVFDADTMDRNIAMESVANMRRMSHAELMTERIGFFACVPDLEGQFTIPKIPKNRELYLAYVRENKEAIKNNDIIKSINAFINTES